MSEEFPWIDRFYDVLKAESIVESAILSMDTVGWKWIGEGSDRQSVHPSWMLTRVYLRLHDRTMGKESEL